MNDLFLFLPETLLLLTTLIFFGLIFVPCAKVGANDYSPLHFPISMMLALLVLAGSLAALSANGSLFGGCYQADSLSQIFKAAIALGF
ncbi:MAG: hypothetical protein HYS56_05335, partial [Candidatus Omnitrophica bacterium]|nr:hypothetical protein [Candidatus Omnitrophota bacterium]